MRVNDKVILRVVTATIVIAILSIIYIMRCILYDKGDRQTISISNIVSIEKEKPNVQPEDANTIESPDMTVEQKMREDARKEVIRIGKIRQRIENKRLLEKREKEAKKDFEQWFETVKVNEINIPGFGVYLGENLTDIQKRFEIKRFGNGRIWGGNIYSGVFDRLIINVKEEKVCLVSFWYRFDTKENFDRVKKQLKDTFQTYEIKKMKSLDKDYDNPLWGDQKGIEFEVIINDNPICVLLLFTYDSAGEDELTVSFNLR